MFGSSKPKKETNGSGKTSPGSLSLNSLVQGTHVEGKVKATSDIRVDGTIKGELRCDAKVIIGPTGAIEGTVYCANAVIEGSFEGNLHVKELLNIRESAKVTGEVSYGKLNVQSGAVISGSYKLESENSNGSNKGSGKGSSNSQDIAEKVELSSKAKVN